MMLVGQKNGVNLQRQS